MIRYFFLLFLASILTAGAQVQQEFILVSGGPSLEEWEKYKAEPHDRWWGNFVRAARVRIQEIQKQKIAEAHDRPPHRGEQHDGGVSLIFAPGAVQFRATAVSAS